MSHYRLRSLSNSWPNRSALRAGSINNREAAQRKFIGSGNEDGSLTGSEARRLGNQQLKMEHKEQYFRADSELTRRESGNINAPNILIK